MAKCIDCGMALKPGVLFGRRWACFKRAYGHDPDEPEPTQHLCAGCMGEGCEDCGGRGWYPA